MRRIFLLLLMILFPTFVMAHADITSSGMSGIATSERYIEVAPGEDWETVKLNLISEHIKQQEAFQEISPEQQDAILTNLDKKLQQPGIRIESIGSTLCEGHDAQISAEDYGLLSEMSISDSIETGGDTRALRTSLCIANPTQVPVDATLTLTLSDDLGKVLAIQSFEGAVLPYPMKVENVFRIDPKYRALVLEAEVIREGAIMDSKTLSYVPTTPLDSYAMDYRMTIGIVILSVVLLVVTLIVRRISARGSFFVFIFILIGTLVMSLEGRAETLFEEMYDAESDSVQHYETDALSDGACTADGYAVLFGNCNFYGPGVAMVYGPPLCFGVSYLEEECSCPEGESGSVRNLYYLTYPSGYYTAGEWVLAASQNTCSASLPTPSSLTLCVGGGTGSGTYALPRGEYRSLSAFYGEEEGCVETATRTDVTSDTTFYSPDGAGYIGIDNSADTVSGINSGTEMLSAECDTSVCTVGNEGASREITVDSTPPTPTSPEESRPGMSWREVVPGE